MSDGFIQDSVFGTDSDKLIRKFLESLDLSSFGLSEEEQYQFGRDYVEMGGKIGTYCCPL